MNRGLKIGRVFGIDITVDLSWIFIFLLVTWNLVAVFGRWHAGWSPGLRLSVAVCAALLFFASVLVHELAHSLVARAHGIDVKSITLFMFGGVSNFEKEPTSPKVEFLSAIVGPLTSLVLGVGFLVLAGVSAGGGLAASLANPQAMIPQLGPIPTLLLWLGPVNIMLAAFNMIPGFPLDGGRVLRSILWAISKDVQKATRQASAVGQGIAWAFMLTGAAMAFGVRVPFFGTGLVGGLWLAFIGWFLNNAAKQSTRQVEMKTLLDGVHVAEVMRPAGESVTPGHTIGQAVHDHLMRTEARAVAVLGDDGRLAGMLTVDDVRKVARGDWSFIPVGRIMTPAERIEVLTPEESLETAIPRLTERTELPVLRTDGTFVGVLYLNDVVRWIELQQRDGARRHRRDDGWRVREA